MTEFDIPDTYVVDTKEETFFDSYEDGATVSVDQDDVDRFMALNDDYNEVHEISGLGYAVAQNSALLETGQLSEDDTIVQGNMTVYEAIRQAHGPVAEAHAEFEAPVNAGDTVSIDHDVSDAGESLTTERPGLDDMYEDTTTATVDLTYADEELENAANAKKVVDTLGFTDHSGHILVSVEAAQLGDGTGELTVSPGYDGEPGYSVAKDLGGPKISEFRYEFSDGTKVKNTVLELDEENYEAALNGFQDQAAADDEDMPDTPAATLTDTAEAYADLVEASTELVMDANREMYRKSLENLLRVQTAPYRMMTSER